jgi:hypothetical protein
MQRLVDISGHMQEVGKDQPECCIIRVLSKGFPDGLKRDQDIRFSNEIAV